jgi:uncharacterized protein (UPF0548 family)
MLTVRKPSLPLILDFVKAQSSLSFTHADVGATAKSLPSSGYVVDRTRVLLGQGEDIFQNARAALETWTQFDLGWVEASPADTPIRAGETVAVLIRAFGLWWLNSARLVYVVDETIESVARFGYAYGTLPGHVEAGEERFLVEWDHVTNQVSYEILAFSRPRHILTRIAQWQVRRMQQRFRDDSAAAMLRAANARANR